MSLTGSALIALSHVTKRYRRGPQEVDVLKDFSLQVQEGEFLAITGPSGSGKTTLLNVIGGLDRPDSGEVHVAAQRIDTLSNRQLARWRATNMGFVFQFYHLLPLLSAAANVELPLALTRLSRAQRQAHVRTALQLVGLDDRMNHRPTELSGGEQQRVAIARALVADARVLLCDEPTGDLDRETSDEILTLLETLNRQHGKTIVIVTHDAAAAARASRELKFDKRATSTNNQRRNAA